MPRVDELFDLRYGHGLSLNGLAQVARPDGVNFVSRAMKNHGVTGRVLTDASPAKAGLLTVALSGNGVLSTFVQPEDFVTGYHVMIMSPRDAEMSLTDKLWWASCILANKYRYSFGRQANRSLASLYLPDDRPDWVNLTVVPEVENLDRPIQNLAPLPSKSAWGTFRLGDLFDIRRGKYVPKAQQRPGLTPVVTSTSFNNGVSKYLDLPATFKAGSIAVARNGSVGEAHYQPEDFFASDDVHVFIPRADLDRFAALFVCAVIRMEKFRYDYGRKWSLERMESAHVKLPQDAAGDPDWQSMRDYMRGLRYSAAVEQFG